MHELQYDLAYFRFCYISIFICNCSGFLLQISFILFLDYFAKLTLLKHKRKKSIALVMFLSPTVPEAGHLPTLSSIHLYMCNFFSLEHVASYYIISLLEITLLQQYY